MCPLRIILIFLSAALAGFFVLKNLKNQPEFDDNTNGDSLNAASSSDSDASPRSSKVLLLSLYFSSIWGFSRTEICSFSYDWFGYCGQVISAIGSGFWTCVDMASGRYLWRNLVASKRSDYLVVKFGLLNTVGMITVKFHATLTKGTDSHAPHTQREIEEEKESRQRKASSKKWIQSIDNEKRSKGEKISKTLADIDGEAEGGNKGFYACYLLTSLSPRHKGHTYIGFTVNPKRRIRQHNGEITMGATRTKKKRPWEMALCIYGFPTQVAALQFEWAWQHPTESLAVRNAACGLKSLSGLPNKIKVAFTMLTLHTWQSMDLVVNFFSTKYMTHIAACPSLPRQMKVQFGSMDDLPCYCPSNQSLHNDDNDWDLDPQECSGSDDIEDLPRRDTNSADDDTAIASSPEKQEYKESQQSQESNTLEPRDSFSLNEVDDFQKNCYEVEHLDQEFNTPMHDCALARKTYMVIEDSGCNQVQPILMEDDDSGCDLVHPFDRRSHLPTRAPDDTQASTIRQIEVIDLFTPSPNCRENTHSKKRKVGPPCTEGSRNNLDLTVKLIRYCSQMKQNLASSSHLLELFDDVPDLA
ncbi:hypothetical protein V2J09_019006 [Rumex salicifolius]